MVHFLPPSPSYKPDEDSEQWIPFFFQEVIPLIAALGSMTASMAYYAIVSVTPIGCQKLVL
jgi:hypothetical protein